ncbi:MAG: SET domain-containing protein [Chloroflexi bacterium]|nr:SET domain-containing protein [Chloroflexota bacterium]
MLLINATIGPSPIHGIGVFTREPIKKGQLVWVRDPRIDISIPVSDIAAFPKPVQDFIYMYGYMTMEHGRKVIVLCGDHGKHMNHADEPNLIEAEDGISDIAARDIEAGEELTCNYYHFDLDAARKLGR